MFGVLWVEVPISVPVVESLTQLRDNDFVVGIVKPAWVPGGLGAPGGLQ